MRLTEGPQEKPWNWQVAVVVMSEAGKFAINDVIFLRDKDVETESRLSELLTIGCDGRVGRVVQPCILNNRTLGAPPFVL